MFTHHSPPARRRRRARLLAVATALVVAGAAVAAPAAPAHAQTECLGVDKTISTFPTGHDGGIVLISITLTNGCPHPVTDWTLTLTFPDAIQVTAGWSAEWTQSGASVTAQRPVWGPPLSPGQSYAFGLIGQYADGFQGPVSCTINGSPCDGGSTPGEPPTVTLTTPIDGATLLYPCPIVLTAEASALGGKVDRVEFYVDDVLVGTDDTAPYELETPSSAHFGVNHTAFARVYDRSDPPRSADSETVEFVVAPPPPANMIIACQREVEVPEGGSGTVRFHLSANATVPATLEVTGPGAAGVTVEPEAFDLDGMAGHEVVVRAAPGSAGTTATITASAEGFLPTSVTVTVTSP